MPATNPVTGKPRKPAMAVLNRIASEPWAITKPALKEIWAIAARQNADPAAVAARLGRPLDNTRTVTIRDRVAIVPVVGPILRYSDFFTEISGGTTTQDLALDFTAAIENSGVDGVVLEIDSPGGMAAGIGELADMIYRARGNGKPIVAYISNYGASAAYYLAAAADEVVIAPSALLGSIGVVMTYVDTSKQDEMLGIREEDIVSSQSPFKRDTPFEEDGRSRYQATVDTLADVFVSDVARFRGVTRTKVLDDFGKGDVLIGKAAVAAGMADRIGTLEKTIRSVASGAAARRISRDEGGTDARRDVPAALTSPGVPIMSGERRDWRAKALEYIFGAQAPESNPEAASDQDAAGDDATPTTEPTETRTRLVPATATLSDTGETARLRAELAREKDARVQAESEARRVREEAAQAAAIVAETTRLETIGRDAAAFADAEIRAERSDPAERAHLVRQYVQAADDDHHRPLAEGSRVSGLTDAHAARPPGRLTQQVVVRDGQVQDAEGQPVAGARVLTGLGSSTGKAKVDPAVVKAMLAATSAGSKAAPSATTAH
jgi:signal peptide peptidase SppA